MLRRKTPVDVLRELVARLRECIDTRCATAMHDDSTSKMSTNDGENEQHIQNQKSEEISFGQVLASTPAVLDYLHDRKPTFEVLKDTTSRLAPMMGIPDRMLTRLYRLYGPIKATIGLCVLLEKFDTVRSPAAYLTWICQGQNAESQLRKLSAVNNAGCLAITS